MRKVVITLSCVLQLHAAQSQISIVQGDMPDVDDTFRISEADIVQLDTSLLKLDSTGVNYYWDFSWMVKDVQRVDTFYSPWFLNIVYNVYFTNPFDQDHFSSYALHVPNMEFGGGMYQFQMTDVYDFYRETSGGYYNVGFGAKINGIPQGFPYDPTDQIYDFVVDYNSTSASYSYWEAEMPSSVFGIGFTYGRKTTRNNTADGWGTLVTPADTFEVLRVKSVMQITDTIYNDSIGFGYGFDRPDLIHYKWLAKNIGVPVLFIEAEDAYLGPVVNRMEYLDPWKQPIGMDDFQVKRNNHIDLFPNPLPKNLSLTVLTDLAISAKSIIKIMDMQGRIVLEFNANPTRGINGYTAFFVDCNGLSPGVYCLEISEDSNSIPYRSKLLLNGN